MDVYFTNTAGVTSPVLYTDNVGTKGVWESTGLFPCTSCCSGTTEPCSGTFYIQTYNTPHTKFVLAVDDFDAENANCNE